MNLSNTLWQDKIQFEQRAQLRTWLYRNPIVSEICKKLQVGFVLGNTARGLLGLNPLGTIKLVSQLPADKFADEAAYLANKLFREYQIRECQVRGYQAREYQAREYWDLLATNSQLGEPAKQVWQHAKEQSAEDTFSLSDQGEPTDPIFLKAAKPQAIEGLTQSQRTTKKEKEHFQYGSIHIFPASRLTEGGKFIMGLHRENATIERVGTKASELADYLKKKKEDLSHFQMDWAQFIRENEPKIPGLKYRFQLALSLNCVESQIFYLSSLRFFSALISHSYFQHLGVRKAAFYGSWIRKILNNQAEAPNDIDIRFEISSSAEFDPSLVCKLLSQIAFGSLLRIGTKPGPYPDLRVKSQCDPTRTHFSFSVGRINLAIQRGQMRTYTDCVEGLELVWQHPLKDIETFTFESKSAPLKEVVELALHKSLRVKKPEAILSHGLSRLLWKLTHGWLPFDIASLSGSLESWKKHAQTDFMDGLRRISGFFIRKDSDVSTPQSRWACALLNFYTLLGFDSNLSEEQIGYVRFSLRKGLLAHELYDELDILRDYCEKFLPREFCRFLHLIANCFDITIQKNCLSSFVTWKLSNGLSLLIPRDIDLEETIGFNEIKHSDLIWLNKFLKIEGFTRKPIKNLQAIIDQFFLSSSHPLALLDGMEAILSKDQWHEALREIFLKTKDKELIQDLWKRLSLFIQEEEKGCFKTKFLNWVDEQCDCLSTLVQENSSKSPANEQQEGGGGSITQLPKQPEGVLEKAKNFNRTAQHSFMLNLFRALLLVKTDENLDSISSSLQEKIFSKLETASVADLQAYLNSAFFKLFSWKLRFQIVYQCLSLRKRGVKSENLTDLVIRELIDLFKLAQSQKQIDASLALCQSDFLQVQKQAKLFTPFFYLLLKPIDNHLHYAALKKRLLQIVPRVGFQQVEELALSKLWDEFKPLEKRVLIERWLALAPSKSVMSREIFTQALEVLPSRFAQWPELWAFLMASNLQSVCELSKEHHLQALSLVKKSPQVYGLSFLKGLSKISNVDTPFIDALNAIASRFEITRSHLILEALAAWPLPDNIDVALLKQLFAIVTALFDRRRGSKTNEPKAITLETMLRLMVFACSSQGFWHLFDCVFERELGKFSQEDMLALYKKASSHIQDKSAFLTDTFKRISLFRLQEFLHEINYLLSLLEGQELKVALNQLISSIELGFAGDLSWSYLEIYLAYKGKEIDPQPKKVIKAWRKYANDKICSDHFKVWMFAQFGSQANKWPGTFDRFYNYLVKLVVNSAKSTAPFQLTALDAKLLRSFIDLAPKKIAQEVGPVFLPLVKRWLETIAEKFSKYSLADLTPKTPGYTWIGPLFERLLALGFYPDLSPETIEKLVNASKALAWCSHHQFTSYSLVIPYLRNQLEVKPFTPTKPLSPDNLKAATSFSLDKSFGLEREAFALPTKKISSSKTALDYFLLLSQGALVGKFSFSLRHVELIQSVDVQSKEYTDSERRILLEIKLLTCLRLLRGFETMAQAPDGIVNQTISLETEAQALLDSSTFYQDMMVASEIVDDEPFFNIEEKSRRVNHCFNPLRNLFEIGNLVFYLEEEGLKLYLPYILVKIKKWAQVHTGYVREFTGVLISSAKAYRACFKQDPTLSDSNAWVNSLLACLNAGATTQVVLREVEVTLSNFCSIDSSYLKRLQDEFTANCVKSGTQSNYQAILVYLSLLHFKERRNHLQLYVRGADRELKKVCHEMIATFGLYAKQVNCLQTGYGPLCIWICGILSEVGLGPNGAAPILLHYLKSQQPSAEKDLAALIVCTMLGNYHLASNQDFGLVAISNINAFLSELEYMHWLDCEGWSYLCQTILGHFDYLASIYNGSFGANHIQNESETFILLQHMVNFATNYFNRFESRMSTLDKTVFYYFHKKIEHLLSTDLKECNFSQIKPAVLTPQELREVSLKKEIAAFSLELPSIDLRDWFSSFSITAIGSEKARRWQQKPALNVAPEHEKSAMNSSFIDSLLHVWQTAVAPSFSLSPTSQNLLDQAFSKLVSDLKSENEHDRAKCDKVLTVIHSMSSWKIEAQQSHYSLSLEEGLSGQLAEYFLQIINQYFNAGLKNSYLEKARNIAISGLFTSSIDQFKKALQIAENIPVLEGFYSLFVNMLKLRFSQTSERLLTSKNQELEALFSLAKSFQRQAPWLLSTYPSVFKAFQEIALIVARHCISESELDQEELREFFRSLKPYVSKLDNRMLIFAALMDTYSDEDWKWLLAGTGDYMHPIANCHDSLAHISSPEMVADSIKEAKDLIGQVTAINDQLTEFLSDAFSTDLDEIGASLIDAVHSGFK